MTEAKFSSQPLSKEMLHNLNELGYTSMTAVQQQSLPHVLNGCDVLAQAKTGSGKTAAFGIGLLHKLNVKKFRIQSLVLCPTRELADQVAKELRRLARATHNVKILTICGGVAFGPQYGSLLHGAHIIVGTPGRILKHLDKGYMSLKDLEILVLDEADRMLDMGFKDELDRVIAHAPEFRQTLLFSATFPDRIKELSATIQKQDAISVTAISDDPPNEITEYFYHMTSDDKIECLKKAIAHHKPLNALVFCNTKMEAQDIADELTNSDIDALALHGDLEQYERTDVLLRFMNNSCAVLVATDVAARGIDIADLALVVNYDIPPNYQTYIHRIGRTGRAGKVGVAVTLYMDLDIRLMEQYRNESRIFDETSSLDDIDKFTLKAPNSTLVIEGGKKDKMRPGDILGALTGEAGITGKYIGKIDLYDRQSYVAIDRSMINKAYAQLKKKKIKGRRFPVWMLGQDKPADMSSVWEKSRLVK